MTRFTGLWRHADFVRLWAGQTVSVFGSLIGATALQFTAVTWLDAGAAGVGLLAACQLAPPFLGGMVFGVWVDRLRRRPMLIAADIGRALLLLSIPAAALFDALTLAQLCAVATCTSALSALFSIAYEAHLPTLIRREQLPEGNAKLAASASVAEVGAFSAAGWLVQLLSAPGALLFDAGSFVASALFLRSIRTVEPTPAATCERRSVAHEAIDGIRVVAGSGLLRSLAATDVLLQLASGMISVAFLLYLAGEVGFGAGVLGMIFAVGGVSSLVGAWAASRPRLPGGLGPAMLVSLVMRAGGALFMPLAGDVSALAVVLLVANQLFTDPAWMFYEINEVSLRQAVTPDGVLGRVNATMRFVSFGALLLGTGAGAAVGATAGPRAALFAAVGMMLGAAVVFAVSPAARMRRLPAP